MNEAHQYYGAANAAEGGGGGGGGGRTTTKGRPRKKKNSADNIHEPHTLDYGNHLQPFLNSEMIGFVWKFER